jgi:hypothetical protein
MHLQLEAIPSSIKLNPAAPHYSIVKGSHNLKAAPYEINTTWSDSFLNQTEPCSPPITHSLGIVKGSHNNLKAAPYEINTTWSDSFLNQTEPCSPPSLILFASIVKGSLIKAAPYEIIQLKAIPCRDFRSIATSVSKISTILILSKALDAHNKTWSNGRSWTAAALIIR